MSKVQALLDEVTRATKTLDYEIEAMQFRLMVMRKTLKVLEEIRNPSEKENETR